MHEKKKIWCCHWEDQTLNPEISTARINRSRESSLRSLEGCGVGFVSKIQYYSITCRNSAEWAARPQRRRRLGKDSAGLPVWWVLVSEPESSAWGAASYERTGTWRAPCASPCPAHSDVCRRIAANADNACLMSLHCTLLCPLMRNSHFIYKELCRERSDEAHQLITGDYPDAAVPLGRPVWRL